MTTETLSDKEQQILNVELDNGLSCDIKCYLKQDVRDAIKRLNNKLLSLKINHITGERILSFRDYIDIQDIFGSKLTEVKR